MHPVDRLAKVDRQLARLVLYEVRLSRMFFAPKTRDRLRTKLNRRWTALTRQRTHLHQTIMADPALKTEMKDRERLAIAKSVAERELKMQEKSVHITDASLRESADDVVALRYNERHAKDAYQDAAWYYKSGQWKNDNVPVDELGLQIDVLRETLKDMQLKRATTQTIFEETVFTKFQGDPEHVLYREQLLQSAHERAEEFRQRVNPRRDFDPAKDAEPAIEHNTFTRWLDSKWERNAEMEKSSTPRKERERQR